MSTLTPQDEIDIQTVITEAGGGDIVEHSFKNTGEGFRFELMCGEDLAEKSCWALVDAGVQHSTRDDKPEFRKSGTDEARHVVVTWRFLDARLPVFSGDLKTD